MATFDPVRVEAAGRHVGRNVYHMLFVIENTIRVLVHSVLTAQIGPQWWSQAVDQRINGNVQRSRQRYQNNPWNTSPGNHDVYYVTLGELTEIIRSNRHLFVPVIAAIDQWIGRLEQIKLPRNVVAHMNWPSASDKRRISLVYADLPHLVQLVGTSNVNWVIP